VRTPVLQGRAFTDRDNASAPMIVIVTQTIADRYWAESEPHWKHLPIRAI